MSLCTCSSRHEERPPIVDATTPAGPPAPAPAPVATIPEASGPRLRIVGVAQDGGLPHAACACPRCAAARVDPSRAASVASAAIILPAAAEVYLIDATPDLRVQLDRLADVRRPPAGAVDRAPLTGVLLTHAHIGHYLGLAFLGFEAVSTRDLPVYATPKMTAFLEANAPWDQLLRIGNLAPRPVEPGASVSLGEEVTATPLQVPHRDEYADTVAWRLQGPRRTILYVPDTEPWERWPVPIEAALAGVDVAIVDGTFYSGDELPGRPPATIGHPLMTATMERLQARVEGGLEVVFIHLNHSNPALDPASPERAAIVRRGFRIAREGEELDL